MNFEVNFGSLPVLQKGVVQMPKIRYKLLCVLMALQIFVLSIGCIDVDEHFVYTPEKLACGCIFSGDSAEANFQFCTAETNGIQNDVQIQILTKSPDERCREASSGEDCLCTYFILEKEQNIRPAGAADQTSAARERKNLIEYIHELDGKKRI